MSISADKHPRTQALAVALARIELLIGQYGDLSKAERLPANREREAREITIGRYDDKGLALELKERVRAAIVAEERARGEREQAEAFAKIAADLESIRAILPQLAASAAIELGEIARGLRK